MIRRFEAFYRRHPNLAFFVMLVVAAAVLYIARDFDAENTAALRLQMLATTRSSV